MARRTWFRDRRTAQWGGYLLIAAGSFMLYDAYENRGRKRPWMSKLAPGP